MIGFIAEHDSLASGYVRDKIGQFINATEDTNRLFRIVKEASKLRMDAGAAAEPYSMQELENIISGFEYTIPSENTPS